MKGFFVSIPIISQCPVIVSFPLLASRIRMKRPSGDSTPFISPPHFKFRNPSLRRFGIFKVFVFSKICPNVSAPSSANRAASGIAPIPRESRTITNILLYISIIPSPCTTLLYLALIPNKSILYPLYSYEQSPHLYRNL